MTTHTDETMTRSSAAGGRDTRRVQKLLAASIWTLVGVGLSVAGCYWMVIGFHWWALLLAVPMIALGFVKGRFILDRMAKRNVQRIADRGPSAPWWGFYPMRTWILVALMMGTGIVLRTVIPDVVWKSTQAAPPVYFACIGLVYLAVGVALIHASRTWWAAFLAREA